MEKVTVKARDGYMLDVHVFEIKKPKAVVQIIHGMEEHQERYEKLAAFLNENGYAVVSSDMRGHGYTAKDLGYFKDKKGYLELIEDQASVTKLIKERFADLPVYIFAHSMGTIITRVLLQEHSNDYAKVVLSGYPNYQSGAKFGIFLAGLIKAFRGPKHKPKMVQDLAVGSFNKKIKNAKTEVDWVCANEENIQNYLADPLCGFGFTCSAFSDLFHLVIKMHKPKNYKNINADMPILMLRGTDDPCTGGEKGAKDSLAVLKKAGFSSIQRIDYEGMRHEIINEKEYQKVFNDTITFYNK